MTKKRKGAPRQLWAVNVPDFLETRPDGTVSAAGERAYRRGYFQGVHTALEALQGGMRLDQLEEWLRQPLYSWRWLAADWITPDRALVSPPPAPGERYKHWRRGMR